VRVVAVVSSADPVNAEHRRATRRRQYHANADKARARARRWRIANPDQARARLAQWRAANPGRAAATRASWAAANPDKIRAYRATDTARRHGLSMAEYEAIRAAGCAACGSHERMVIDHCHDTGRVRGGLCNGCNVAVGHLHNDPVRADAVAAYLRRSVA